MVLVNNFTEFIDKVKALHKSDPIHIRFSTKTRGQNDQIEFRATNNK